MSSMRRDAGITTIHEEYPFFKDRDAFGGCLWVPMEFTRKAIEIALDLADDYASWIVLESSFHHRVEFLAEGFPSTASFDTFAKEMHLRLSKFEEALGLVMELGISFVELGFKIQAFDRSKRELRVRPENYAEIAREIMSKYPETFRALKD